MRSLFRARHAALTFAHEVVSPFFWLVFLEVGALIGATVTTWTQMSIPPSDRGLVAPLVGAFVASLAFCVASATFMFNWRKGKVDLFVSIHEKLIAPEIQKGRRILANQADTVLPVYRLTDDQFESVNRALALYDTLAMYATRRNVIKADVWETWGVAMHRRAPQIRAFIAWRAMQDEYRSWPHLTAMLDDLEENPLSEATSADGGYAEVAVLKLLGGRLVTQLDKAAGRFRRRLLVYRMLHLPSP